jgi:HlyD family secretion protein
MATAVRLLRGGPRVKRGYLALVAVLVCCAALAAWTISRKSAPPEIPFAKVTRENIVSTLSTNGKVEPIEWAPARAERSGVVQRVVVQKGQTVGHGEPLVELDAREATAQLANAEAQIKAARAQIQILNQGGAASAQRQIESELERTKLDAEAARKDYDALQRLAAKQAATGQEVTVARQRVEQLELQIRSLEQRRSALVAPPDKQVAAARLEEAQAAADLARGNLALSVVHAPIAGTVYQFDLRVGSFVNAGDLVATIGKLERVRVTVYVDEPELGRVRAGVPVVITWDALPGRTWKGHVDRLPTQIVPLGTRQVGEVSCIIENPDRDLLPGTNVNAEIQSALIADALTIPKEAVRREGGQDGVLALTGDRVKWRNIKLGVFSYTKTQVLNGLSEGDSIVLPTDKPLRDDSRVKPVYP